MHFQKILDLYGCTNSRLRQVFTATDGEDMKIRKRIEDRVKSRVDAGLRRCLRTASMYQAVDVAWDTPPIQKETLPLLLWAQGKVSRSTILAAKGTDESPSPMSQYVKKDEAGNVTLDLPKIYEISISLVRSYVTRRHAAQTTKYANLWPFFKFEPRGTDDISSLQGDALSQVVEKMSDDFNYRHFFPQADRDKLLYGYSLVFPRQAWTRRNGWRPKKLNVQAELTKDDVESYVVAEGLDYVNPPAARTFWDNSAPLANINTENGPRWVGYWDIIPFKDLQAGGASYFNLDKVSRGDKFVGLLKQYGAFFEYYFDPKVVNPTDIVSDPSLDNDRTANVGRWTSQNQDAGVLHAQYFERINPKEEKIAEYDVDVWVRYAVAGDGTIIGAEWMPSIPAAYGGFNQNDQRDVSVSYAMELMPYQDQLTNLCTQMLFNIRTSMIQLWLLDKDSMEEATLKHFEDGAKARDFFTEPKILKYSATKLRELGIQDPRQAFSIIQANVAQTIETSYQGIMRLLAIVDRLSNTSRNELGESNPREISATEAQEISATTATMHTFISDGIDEQRSAIKRQIFESYVSRGSATFEAPVISRYTIETIRDAGFELARQQDVEPGTVMPANTRIRGSVWNLIYSYAFDSRDGSERSSNPQSAQLLVQLAQMMLGSEQLVQAMGKRRLYALFNTIVRLSGAGWDLKLELDPNEDEAMGPSKDEIAQLVQKIQQIEQVLQQVIAQIQQPPMPPAGAPPPQALPDEAMLLAPEQQAAMPAA